MAEITEERGQHSPRIQLGASSPGDEGALARLWCMTFAEKWRHLFGNLAEAFLETWLLQDPKVHEGSVLAQVDGAAAGFIHFDAGTPTFSRSSRKLWQALRGYFGPVGAFTRLLRLWIIERSPRFAANELHIKMLAVDPHWRGKGLARRLLNYAEHHARNEGREFLVLDVAKNNQDAIRLYERYGFQKLQHSSRPLLRWASGQGQYLRMRKAVR